LKTYIVNVKKIKEIDLQVEAKNEEEAMQMYSELAKASSDKEQKEMFDSLARMEQGHKVKLEGLYADMAYPEVW